MKVFVYIVCLSHCGVLSTFHHSPLILFFYSLLEFIMTVRTFTAVATCGCGHGGRLGVGGTVEEEATLSSHIPRVVELPPSAGDVCSVHCGAYHTIARTTTGLYGWGIEEDGQLGFGPPSSSPGVYAPRRMTFFDTLKEQYPADAATPFAIKGVACGANHSIVWTTAGVYGTGLNQYGQLGLGHEETVFEWTQLFPLPSESGAQLTHVSAGTHHTVFAWRDTVQVEEGQYWYYPTFLSACGKGDFGELGYDGDASDAERAKTKRLYQQLLQETNQRDGAEPQTVEENPSQKFNWKPKKVRRAEFSSNVLRKVEFPLLDSSRQALEEGLPPPESGRSTWLVESLQAMRLHTSVQLRCEETGERRTYHWGCYYCGEVEGKESSIPKEETTLELYKEHKDSGVRFHAGDELLVSFSGECHSIAVKGSGVLGLGEEDSFCPEWTTVALSEIKEGVKGVLSVVGTHHTLVLVSLTTEGGTAVLGFGDNLHGQLCSSEEDSVDRITALHCLVPGSRIQSSAKDKEWTIQKVGDIGAGARHSVFLLELTEEAASVN
ncbi:chromatin binding protein [Angomonas deanei]|nr:chromatin binding protein [Angomonas deanei]|eukprot:EPY37439.1 chromatin binding protein [Angomonas deanei]